ncbi:MAG: DUF3667 domain-containing protein [Bacteroidota bacterium]
MSSQSNLTCKNCGHPAEEKFCPNCGQSTDVRRFNGSYFLYKLIHSFDLDRGFFHTIFLLLKKPGLAISDFIGGKRVGFSNPFKVFLITGAVATFWTLHSGDFDYKGEEIWIANYLNQWYGFVEYSGKYFSFFTLTGMIVFSFFTWLFFIKSGYNFYENVILNFYIASGQFIIVLLFVPLFWLEKASFLIDDLTGWVYGSINTGYNIWVVVVFFKAYKLRALLIAILAVLIPYPISGFMNYWIYVIAPESFWEYLDSILM